MVKNTVLWGTHYFLSDENKKIFTEITKKRGDMFLIVARPLCLGGGLFLHTREPHPGHRRVLVSDRESVHKQVG